MNDLYKTIVFHLGNDTFKISTFLLFLLFGFFINLLLRLIKKVIYKTDKFDIAKKYAIYNLARYFILIFAALIGLQILGFNLSVLLAGSAALLVGIGLGLQTLFSDFTSGIIILFDSSVKVNDVIDINGLVGKVLQINLRTTTVLTRDDKYIILPNSDLTKNQLINWTHNEVASRFEVSVGVDYSSDVSLVMKILKQAVEKQKGILLEPVPFVRFTDYADSSLNFSVFFWSDDVFRVENIKSEIRVRIFKLFNENNIQIPFPQRVLHIKNEIGKTEHLV
ncbi:MAG: mechanosensitive ion channel protein MscS [Bacteroidetes bacterium GWE2_29_8]|nr:MAG: mechanosensitive ion channel protein MscS [Bacteroidetes bacterium GWE2_29_8]